MSPAGGLGSHLSGQAQHRAHRRLQPNVPALRAGLRVAVTEPLGLRCLQFFTNTKNVAG